MKKRKLVYCFIISFVFLLLFTKSSPLYRINDWYDAQCFFTMGKSMINGKVPYLDLFEQKGPLLFLLYGIATLISTNSFIGIFILELISFTIFLYYIDKIIGIFIKDEYSYILLPILSMLILASYQFQAGGSCEELCLPLITIPLYYFIKYLKTDKLSNKEALITGILSSCIFWMKYTLLGFSIGFCLVVLIKKIKEKDYKDLIYKIIFFILGFIAISIPWIIYFSLYKDGLKSLIDTYFLFNINNYANKMNIIVKILHCLLTIIGVTIGYFQYLLLIFIPIFLSIKKQVFFKERENNIYLLIVSITLITIIFIGGTNFRYYSLPMGPLMIFGLIYIIKYKEEKKTKIPHINTNLTIKVIVLSLLLGAIISPNTKFILKNQSYYAQYEFSKKIESNKTILNYGFLDGGFYFTTNTYPSTYYFQKNNIKYELCPKNMDEQNEYIKESKTDYVIVRKIKNKQKKMIEKNYELIATHAQEYEGKNVKYSLYKKKNLSTNR